MVLFGLEDGVQAACGEGWLFEHLPDDGPSSGNGCPSAPSSGLTAHRAPDRTKRLRPSHPTTRRSTLCDSGRTPDEAVSGDPSVD
uniref:Orf_Bo107 n=1 Tax=Agrobacterium tumefaciens TaxID=358 RepID=A5WY27_AGRTU|nr:hypothetical protein [Agrobacterium tumefaciens]AAZ50495.1 orf_Bo107 [Agrobacterium tumefaciens]ARU12540.1 hypothetical protein AgrTiChry5_127 [Agrobacterium tumefaciens]